MSALAAALLAMLGGMLLLGIGAAQLVEGASRLALRAGIPPLVIGLTVVAFGTSSPEFAVAISSAIDGKAEITVGNVIGSNIANLLLILGLSALVTPLLVHQQLIRMDIPIMIGASVLVYVLASDGRFGRTDGILLFVLGVAYTVFLVADALRSRHLAREGVVPGAPSLAPPRVGGHWLLDLLRAALGLGLLLLGSEWLVSGAVRIALALGMSELLVGLTIVAVGTSLPELATSVVAAFRGERDIAVGNVIGSNIFNILPVLGLSTAIAGQVAVPAEVRALDLPVMLAASLIVLPLFRVGYTVTRTWGALFLGGYAIYVVYLVLGALDHALLGVLGSIVRDAVVPALVVMTVVVLVRGLRREEGSG